MRVNLCHIVYFSTFMRCPKKPQTIFLTKYYLKCFNPIVMNLILIHHHHHHHHHHQTEVILPELNNWSQRLRHSEQHWFRFIEMQQSNCVSRLYLDVCVVVVVVGWRWDDMMTSDQDVYSFWQFSPPETDCGDQLPSHRRYPRLSPFRLWSSPVPFYMCF